MFENPEIRSYNAIFLKNENVLRLIIDSETRIDIEKLSALLPDELKIDVKYNSTDPFIKRQKRKITII